MIPSSVRFTRVSIEQTRMAAQTLRSGNAMNTTGELVSSGLSHSVTRLLREDSYGLCGSPAPSSRSSEAIGRLLSVLKDQNHMWVFYNIQV
jgi:hypothetical protein